GTSFSAGPAMSSPRAFHTATDTGSTAGATFLIAGGQDNTGKVLPTAQVYTSSTNAFTATTNNMTANRLGHTGTRVPSTNIVLVAGGMDSNGNPLKSADKYSIAGNSFSVSAGAMTAARVFHTATLLLDGTELVAGGNGPGNVPLATAEIYTPGTDSFAA